MNAIGTAAVLPLPPAGFVSDIEDTFRLSLRAQEIQSANIHGTWMPFILQHYRKTCEAFDQLTDALPQIGEFRIMAVLVLVWELSAVNSQ